MVVGVTTIERWGRVLLVLTLALTGVLACQSAGETERVSDVRPPGTQELSSALVSPTLSKTSIPRATPSRQIPSPTGTEPAPSLSPTSARQPTDVEPTATPTIPPATSPPTRIVVPSIELDAPVVALGWHLVDDSGKTAWDDPRAAAGWLKNTALPGRGSNVVLAGHHNVRGEVFRYLVDVRVGDAVYLMAEGITYNYRVAERFILPEKHASAEQKEQNALWIAPTIDERLTLVTCWPYGGNAHRLIVVAKPDSALPAMPHHSTSRTSSSLS